MSYCTVWSSVNIAVDIRLKCKDIKGQNKKRQNDQSDCQCDWCSSVCSSSVQHKPASGLLISPCPPWLCVLSSVWQGTSASLQPPATGLAQSPVSLPQWDLMDSHQEAVHQAAILGSPCCLWESLTGQWLYQQSMGFLMDNNDTAWPKSIPDRRRKPSRRYPCSFL